MRAPRRKLSYTPSKSPKTLASWVPGTYSSPRSGRATMASVANIVSTVNTLKRKATVDTSTVFYKGIMTTSAGSIGGSAASYVNLTQYSRWSRCFGTDADDETGKMARIKSIAVDWAVKANGEQNNVDVMVAMFRLRDEASPDINTSGDFISGTWPTQDADMAYYPPVPTSEFPGIAGGFLNPKKYQVLYSKRFILNPSNAVLIQNMVNAVPAILPGISSMAVEKNQQRGHKTLTFGKQGLLLKAPGGDWKTTLRPLNTRNNVYFGVFTNDSSLDLSTVQVHMQQLVKLEV